MFINSRLNKVLSDIVKKQNRTRNVTQKEYIGLIHTNTVELYENLLQRLEEGKSTDDLMAKDISFGVIFPVILPIAKDEVSAKKELISTFQKSPDTFSIKSIPFDCYATKYGFSQDDIMAFYEVYVKETVLKDCQHTFYKRISKNSGLFSLNDVDLDRLENDLNISRIQIEECFKYAEKRFKSETCDDYNNVLRRMTLGSASHEDEMKIENYALVLGKTSADIQADIKKDRKRLSEELDCLLASLKQDGYSEHREYAILSAAKCLGREKEAEELLADSKDRAAFNKQVKKVYRALLFVFPILEIILFKWWSLLTIPATWIILPVCKNKICK